MAASEISPAPTQESERHPEFQFGTPVNELYSDPAGFDPGEDLSAAVEVALILGLPLLLTGDPGCGKTSVAYWLAWRLGLGEPLVFNVKSTSIGRDLLYQYDELARFRDAQRGGAERKPHGYLTLNALGKAILLSTDAKSSAAAKVLEADHAAGESSDAGEADASAKADHRPATRRIVLIDELDKAPRDMPNDLLLEVEQMRFRIPELDLEIVGGSEMRPVVVITSNSERSLPEPFLRRCVFYHIPAPDVERRRQIVERRNHPFCRRARLFDEAMLFFDDLSGRLSRKPGNAELLAWLTELEHRVARASSPDGAPPASLKGLARPSLGILAKTRDDLETAQQALAEAEPGWT